MIVPTQYPFRFASSMVFNNDISRIGVLPIAMVEQTLALSSIYHDSSLYGDLYQTGAQIPATGCAIENTLVIFRSCQECP